MAQIRKESLFNYDFHFSYITLDSTKEIGPIFTGVYDCYIIDNNGNKFGPCKLHINKKPC